MFPWWVWLLLATIGAVLWEIGKKTQVGWVLKLGETAVYLTEQKSLLEKMTSEEKKNHAVKMFRELAEMWKVTWLIKFIPDSVIINIIESVVGKMNWNRNKKMTQEEFNKDMDIKIQNLLGTSEKLKENLELTKK